MEDFSNLTFEEYASYTGERTGKFGYNHMEQNTNFEEMIVRFAEIADKRYNETEEMVEMIGISIETALMNQQTSILILEEYVDQIFQMLKEEEMTIPSPHVENITHESEEYNQELANSYWTDSEDDMESDMVLIPTQTEEKMAIPSLHENIGDPDEDFCLGSLFEITSDEMVISSQQEDDTEDDFQIFLTDDWTTSEIMDICKELPDHEITMEELDKLLDLEDDHLQVARLEDHSVTSPVLEPEIPKDAFFVTPDGKNPRHTALHINSGKFLNSYLLLNLHFKNIFRKSKKFKVFGFQPFLAFCLDMLKIKRGKGDVDIPFDNG